MGARHVQPVRRRHRQPEQRQRRLRAGLELGDADEQPVERTRPVAIGRAWRLLSAQRLSTMRSALRAEMRLGVRVGVRAEVRAEVRGPRLRASGKVVRAEVVRAEGARAEAGLVQLLVTEAWAGGELETKQGCRPATRSGRPAPFFLGANRIR